MSPEPRRRPGPKAYSLITLFAFALVVLPFLFWYQTWFGRRLSDSELDRYFSDGRPRHAQHALVQLGERISRGQDISRWRPNVLQEAVAASYELRQTAAWIMGQDGSYPPFHRALLKLIEDREPMVRRNAALSLAALGDPAGRPELLRMLAPFHVFSVVSGVVRYRVKLGEYVNPGTLVAHVGGSEVRSAAPGKVGRIETDESAAVAAGEPLLELEPDKDHAWEALRALYLVGTDEDLQTVERYARGAPGMPANIQRQATLTAQMLRSRKPAP